MKKNNRKGFTLIELLAVIIVLALILVFAIPAVLDTSSRAQKKTFTTYARKVLTLAQEYVEARKLDGASGKMAFDNVSESTDFSLGTNDTEYKVCVEYNPTAAVGEQYKLYMKNNTFYVAGATDANLKQSSAALSLDDSHRTTTPKKNTTNNTCSFS